MSSTTRAPVRRALASENGASQPTQSATNRFGFRDTTNTVKRGARAPARGAAGASASVAKAEPSCAEPAPAQAAPSAPVAVSSGAPDDGAVPSSTERRRSGAAAAARRRRSSVRTPMRPGELLTVDENGQLPEGIDSPPPTPIDISSAVASMFCSERDEANALVNHKVRAKKYDYKERIAQQSEVIAKLKQCLTTMLEKSSEVREKSLAAQESANSKVQSLALAKKPMKEQIAGLGAQLEALKAVHAETAAARTELQARFEALSAMNESDRSALDAAAARVEQTEDELDAEKERADAAEERLAAAQKRLDGTEKEVCELAEKLRASGVEHEKQLDTLRESIERRTERQKAEHEAVATELGARCDEAAGELESVGAELDACVAERDELRARAAALADAQARLESEAARAVEELRGTRAELGKKESDLSESLRSISRMQTEAIERQAELREEKRGLAERLAGASERADRLDEAAGRSARECCLLEGELREVDGSDARARAALAVAEAARLEAMELLLGAQSELTVLRQEHAQLHAGARDAAAERDAARAQLESARTSELAARSELEASRGEARDLEVEFRTYKAHCGSSNMEQMGALVKLQRECEALNARFEDARGQLGAREGETQSLQAEVADRARYVAELETKLLDAEETRRRLHNTVQELKGNIRVFCRVRPPTDDAAAGACVELQPDGESMKLTTTSAGERSARELSHSFSFDKVFAPGTSQADVFGEVSSLVQSALDGYKVCIFAYGQTGSGKTFTMQGTSDERNCGIVPRSLKQIFQATRAAKEKGWTYELCASFVEVYNENVRDLLAPPGAPPGAHSIVHDEAFGTVVTDVTRLPVTAEEQIDQLARMAARQRSVGKTDMNSVSSRSHAIFMLYLTGTNPSVGHTLHGALHLVDLAGSERLSRSNATGATLKETQAINKSLSALGDVFTSITNKASHVPFRNSKLTYLMAPCLSGDGKTLMVVNVAPEADNGSESLSSLRFASQVNACEIGRPKRSVKAGGAGGSAAEQQSESRRTSISSVQSAATARPSTARPTTGAARQPLTAAAAVAAARKAAATQGRRPATAR